MAEFLPFTILNDENSHESEEFDEIFYCKLCGEIYETSSQLIKHNQTCPKVLNGQAKQKSDMLLRKMVSKLRAKSYISRNQKSKKQKTKHVQISQKRNEIESPKQKCLPTAVYENCVTMSPDSKEKDDLEGRIKNQEHESTKSLVSYQQEENVASKNFQPIVSLTVKANTQSKAVLEPVHLSIPNQDLDHLSVLNQEITNYQEPEVFSPGNGKPIDQVNYCNQSEQRLCDICGGLEPEQHSCLVSKSLPLNPIFLMNSDELDEADKTCRKKKTDKTCFLESRGDNSTSLEDFICLQCGKTFLGTCSSIRITDDEQLFNIESSIFCFFRCELLSIKNKIREGIVSFSVDEFTPLLTRDFKKKIYRCRLCSDYFTDLEHLLHHAMNIKKQCIICLQPLNSVGRTRDHMQNHKHLIKTTNFFRRVFQSMPLGQTKENDEQDVDISIDSNLSKQISMTKYVKIQSSKLTKSSDIPSDHISSGDQTPKPWNVEIVQGGDESSMTIICKFSKFECESLFEKNNETTIDIAQTRNNNNDKKETSRLIQVVNGKFVTDGINLGAYEPTSNNKKMNFKHGQIKGSTGKNNEQKTDGKSSTNVANIHNYKNSSVEISTTGYDPEVQLNNAHPVLLSTISAPQTINVQSYSENITNNHKKDLGTKGLLSSHSMNRPAYYVTPFPNDVQITTIRNENTDVNLQNLGMSYNLGSNVTGQFQSVSAKNCLNQSAQITCVSSSVQDNLPLTKITNSISRHSHPLYFETQGQSANGQSLYIETHQPANMSGVNSAPLIYELTKTQQESSKSNNTTSVEFIESRSIIDEILEMTGETSINTPQYIMNPTIHLPPALKSQIPVLPSQKSSSSIDGHSMQMIHSLNGMQTRLSKPIFSSTEPLSGCNIETKVQKNAPLDKESQVYLNYQSNQTTLPQSFDVSQTNNMVTTSKLMQQSVHSTTEHNEQIRNFEITGCSNLLSLENIENSGQQVLNQETPNTETVTLQTSSKLREGDKNITYSSLLDRQQHGTSNVTGSITNTLDENLSRIQSYMHGMKEDMTEEEEIAFFSQLNCGEGDPFKIAICSDEEAQSLQDKISPENNNIASKVSNLNNKTIQIVQNFDLDNKMENPLYIQEVEVISSSNFCGKVNRPKSKQLTKFQCDLCTLSFKKEVHLYKHKELHLKNPMTCWECAVNFSSMEEFKKHQTHVHRKL